MVQYIIVLHTDKKVPVLVGKVLNETCKFRKPKKNQNKKIAMVDKNKKNINFQTGGELNIIQTTNLVSC